LYLSWCARFVDRIKKQKYLYAAFESKVEMVKGKQSFVNMRVTLTLRKYLRNCPNIT
jgi:hypothetical protein